MAAPVVVDDRVAVRGARTERDVAKARRTAAVDDRAQSPISARTVDDHAVGIGRAAPDECHPASRDLRGNPQDVRCQGETRRSAMPSLGRQQDRPGLDRRRRPGRFRLEHHSCRPQFAARQEAAGNRPRPKDERRQHGHPRRQATLGPRRRQRGKLQPLPRRRARARALSDTRRAGRPKRLPGLLEEPPCLLGETRIDQHQLGADRPKACKIGLDGACVHRDSLTGCRGRDGGTRSRFERRILRS
jgi:hypothetical protein